MNEFDIAKEFCERIFPDELRKSGVIILKDFNPGGTAKAYIEDSDLEKMLLRSKNDGASLGVGIAVRKKDFHPSRGSQGGERSMRRSNSTQN